MPCFESENLPKLIHRGLYAIKLKDTTFQVRTITVQLANTDKLLKAVTGSLETTLTQFWRSKGGFTRFQTGEKPTQLIRGAESRGYESPSACGHPMHARIGEFE
jgi:hypothetical protein